MKKRQEFAHGCLPSSFSCSFFQLDRGCSCLHGRRCIFRRSPACLHSRLYRPSSSFCSFCQLDHGYFCRHGHQYICQRNPIFHWHSYHYLLQSKPYYQLYHHFYQNQDQVLGHYDHLLISLLVHAFFQAFGLHLQLGQVLCEGYFSLPLQQQLIHPFSQGILVCHHDRQMDLLW